MMGQIALIAAASTGAGINLYLTLLCLGLYARLGAPPAAVAAWIEPFGSWWVIAPAAVLFVVEFFADKTPGADNVWDALHTLVRPAGAVLIALALTEDLATASRVAAMLGAGTLAFGFHGAKAGVRMTARMNPEPATNALSSPLLSAVEDLSVGSLMYLAFAHPLLALGLVGLAIAALLYFGPRLYHLAHLAVASGLARLAWAAGDLRRPDCDRVPRALYEAIRAREAPSPEMTATCWIERPGLFNYRRACLVLAGETLYVAFRRFFLRHVVTVPRPEDGAGVTVKPGLIADRLSLGPEHRSIRLLFLPSQRPWLRRLGARLGRKEGSEAQATSCGSAARPDPSPAGGDLSCQDPVS